MTRAIAPGPHSAELRKQLGPTAWCALECLVERSDDGRTTLATVRSVAADLGVAKNTAHRAMSTLARAGLVESVQTRDGEGRFEPGRYLLHLGDLSAIPPTSTTTARRAKRAPRPSTSSPAQQLTLLPRA